MRIRRVEPSGFRGVRFAAPLSFGAAGSSAIIYGANGRGKSSYVDALEWYLHRSIKHLEREDVKRAAYRHRAVPQEEVASVQVEFVQPDLGGSLQIDAERRVSFEPDSEEAKKFQESASNERVILRHRDLTAFVEKTKTDKLRELAPLIGTELLTEARDELRKALHILEGDLEKQDGKIDERSSSLCQHLTLDACSEEAVWERVNSRLQALGVAIKSRTSDALLKALERVRVTTDRERSKRLTKLRDAKETVENLAALPGQLAAGREFTTAFNTLARDSSALQQLQLAELWTAGHAVLVSDWWTKDECPLCGQAIRPDELTDRLESLLDKMSEARQAQRDVEDAREQAKGEANGILPSCNNSLESLDDIDVCKALRGHCARLVKALRAVDLEYEKPLVVGQSVETEPFDQWAFTVEDLKEVTGEAVVGLDALLEEEGISAKDQERLDAYSRLGAAAADLARVELLTAERSVIEAQVESVRVAAHATENAERRTIQRILDRISDNVTRYYEALHQGERYSNVRLNFHPDHRGLEFTLEAYGETISPPQVILSESRLSSLGLCLFLAAAREFNTRTRFLVLDDIVNSFDADHRCQLAQLLINEFDDFQIIVFTHDRVFYDFVRRLGADWCTRTLAEWTYEYGVEILGDVGEGRHLIDFHLGQAGHESIAGNLARQEIEQLLKHICRELRVPLPYRDSYENDRRASGELLKYLRRHVKGRGRFEHRDAPVWRDLQASNFITNLASHDQPEVEAGLGPSDIKYALEKADELLDLFRCGNCGKWAWDYRAKGDEENRQCHCGRLQV